MNDGSLHLITKALKDITLQIFDRATERRLPGLPIVHLFFS